MLFFLKFLILKVEEEGKEKLKETAKKKKEVTKLKSIKTFVPAIQCSKQAIWIAGYLAVHSNQKVRCLYSYHCIYI